MVCSAVDYVYELLRFAVGKKFSRSRLVTIECFFKRFDRRRRKQTISDATHRRNYDNGRRVTRSRNYPRDILKSSLVRN